MLKPFSCGRMNMCGKLKTELLVLLVLLWETPGFDPKVPQFLGFPHGKPGPQFLLDWEKMSVEQGWEMSVEHHCVFIRETSWRFSSSLPKIPQDIPVVPSGKHTKSDIETMAQSKKTWVFPFIAWWIFPVRFLVCKNQRITINNPWFTTNY